MSEEHKVSNAEVQQRPIIIEVPQRDNNSMGLAGFVLSIVAIFMSCIPFVNWILWLLGLIFSLMGVFKRPRCFAIAGLIISLFWLVMMILLIVGLVSLYSLSEIQKL